MRIVFMGTPQFSLPALEQIISSDYDLVAVYSQPDRPSGRGKKVSSPPVKKMADDYRVPVFQPENLNNPLEIEKLLQLAPDVIVVVAFGQLLPKTVLDIPEHGCLNIHASLLPKYRGASPVASAILAGESETGVSIMLLDEGMDTGPVISQHRIPINPVDTTESLEMRLARTGADLLMNTIPEWCEQKVEPQRQNNIEATYTKQISKKDGELDWRLSAAELSRRIRAYYPWPICYTWWRGKILKILEAFPFQRHEEVSPGVVLSMSDEYDAQIGVSTSHGVLGLYKLQLEGKKAMSAPEFLRGQRDFIGQRLG